MFGRDSLQTTSPTVGEARLLSQQRSDAFKQKKKETYDKTHRPLNLQIGDLVKRRIPVNRPDVKKVDSKIRGPLQSRRSSWTCQRNDRRSEWDECRCIPHSRLTT